MAVGTADGVANKESNRLNSNTAFIFNFIAADAEAAYSSLNLISSLQAVAFFFLQIVIFSFFQTLSINKSNYSSTFF